MGGLHWSGGAPRPAVRGVGSFPSAGHTPILCVSLAGSVEQNPLVSHPLCLLTIVWCLQCVDFCKRYINRLMCVWCHACNNKTTTHPLVHCISSTLQFCQSTPQVTSLVVIGLSAVEERKIQEGPVRTKYCIPKKRGGVDRWVVPLLWGPLVAVSITASLAASLASGGAAAAAVTAAHMACGAALWQMSEYTVHRWVWFLRLGTLPVGFNLVPSPALC